MTSRKNQGPLNLEDLILKLHAQNESVTDRIDAASRLADLASDPRSVHALIEVLETETEARLLMHVISLLARKKIYSAVMPLIDMMLCMGRSGIEKADPAFAQAESGIRIRIAAIQALGRMGDERAIVPLMSILGNQRENYRLRLAAAESLGRLGDGQAVNPLINIVQDDHEPSQYLKESAIKALGMLGDMRALEPLLDIFDSQKGLKSKFNFLKEQIIEAIGRIGSNQNRALKTLLEALHDESPGIRLSAVESLSEVADTSCVAPLKECLFDSDDDVALAAVSALYHLGGEALIREILTTHENLPNFIRQELETYVP